VYPEIEQVLLNVQLTHPRGNDDINDENDKKWRQVLNQYLVDKRHYDIHQWRQSRYAVMMLG